jgi:subtilisin family serine protease
MSRVKKTIVFLSFVLMFELAGVAGITYYKSNSVKGVYKYSLSEGKLNKADKLFLAKNKDDSLILKVRTKEDINQLSYQYGLTDIKEITFGDGYIAYEVRTPKKAKNTFLEVESSPRIIDAWPNYLVKKAVTPNDTLYSLQWALPKIQAPQAWDIDKGSSSVIVAVIDTGVEYNHPDLAGNVWRNTAEVIGNGIDDDNNNYIDDYWGFDFSSATYNSATGKWSQDSDGPMDNDGHGTHVSGIISAVTNNNLGVAGLSWHSKIMAVKFIDGEYGTTANAIRSIKYAIDNGAKILNCSWGGEGRDMLLVETLEYAKSSGAIIIGAAGNNSANLDNNPFYPASESSVMAVSATDQNDQLASFSNYGSVIEVSAPGVNIASTMLGTYFYSSGTSMAAPYVSALAALLWSKNPTWTNEQIKNAIKASVDDLGSTGRDNYFGHGRINAFKALSLTDPFLVDVDSSSVNFSTNQVVAGESIDLDITLRDLFGQLISGYQVVVSSSVSSDVVGSIPVTSQQGFTSASIGFTVSGKRIITVRDQLSNIVLSSREVTVLPSDLNAIQVVTSKDKIMPISLNYTLLTVIAVDLYGNKISGVNVFLQSSRGDQDEINPVSGLTDANGRFIASIKSNNLGSLVISVSAEGLDSSQNLKVVKTGDLNDDSQINIYDASVLMSSWGKITNPLADINSDGIVNIYDASILMSNWNK